MSRIESFRRRGEIVKSETKGQVTMERRLLVRRYQLVWYRDNCVGCGICADMCPKEAIRYLGAEFKAGRRVSDRPRIDFDPDKCVLCGECVVSCPMNDALVMTVNGKRFVPVIEENAFAMVTRKTSL
jgi:ferredoxin